jgi:hypothetical protein
MAGPAKEDLMHNSVTALTVASLFCAGVSVFAQAGAQSTAPLPDSSSRQSDMVITGCLKSSSSDAARGATVYTLEGRMPRQDIYPPRAKPAAEDATAPHATPITPANTMFSLSALPSVSLADHVGHTVELAGRMQPAQSGAVGTAGTAGAQAQTQAVIPGGAHKTFEVSAVKMLSMKCE